MKRKTITVTVSCILAALLLLTVAISCKNDTLVDEAFTATIFFDGNGATEGAMASQKTGKSIPTKLNGNAFEKTDAIFTGWNTTADGTGTAYSDGQGISLDSDLTLYAQWRHFRYITFDANGAEGTMESQKVLEGSFNPLDVNSFTWDDHLFMGWNTIADGSGTSYADEQEICIDENVTLYARWAIALTSEMTTLTNGSIYLLDSDVTIEDRITVNGNVTLLLSDGYTLTATKGITVNEGNSLTIDAMGNGTGTLNAFCPDESPLYFYAAIGGERYCNSGLITINGGNVDVIYNGTYGAAIGGGGGGGSGTVTINGGNVNVIYNGTYGAAIGGGDNGSGTVTINGGNVTATYNGIFGASIGGGNDGNGSVIINDGNVSITHNVGHGSGIGGGKEGDGTVTINGGIVNVTCIGDSCFGAAIGGGNQGIGMVTIYNGTVTATAGTYGAAIGGGDFRSGTVTIYDGTVTAIAGQSGAAIGGGVDGNGTVTIHDGIVTATAGKHGAAIGCGYGGYGGTIIINGGTVNATVGDEGYGAGIGGCLNCEEANVIINGGQILAVGGGEGGDGIGMGKNGEGKGTLTLGEGVSLEVSSNNTEWSAYDGSTRKRYMRTI